MNHEALPKERASIEKEVTAALLEKAVSEAREIMNDPDLSIDLNRAFAVLKVWFHDKKSDVAKSLAQLKIILEENNLKFGSLVEGGGSSTARPCLFGYKIDRIRIDGALNWRSWIMYPDVLTQHNQKLLDNIVNLSDDVALRAEKKGIDSMDKLWSLLDLAVKDGLITQEESREVEDQAYEMCWGHK